MIYTVTNTEGMQDSDAVAEFFCLDEPPHTYYNIDSNRVRFYLNCTMTVFLIFSVLCTDTL